MIKKIARSHRHGRSRGGFPIDTEMENHPVCAFNGASRYFLMRSHPL